MPSLSNAAHRFYLRVVKGRETWHQRYYRPSVHVVRSDSQLWFEEFGKVFTAYPLQVLVGRFEGNRCNLLLSGPSTQEITDPARLTQHDLMGVNGSPRLLSDRDRKMRIYHVNDATYLRSSLDDFVNYAGCAEFTIIDFRGMYELIRLLPEGLPETKFVVYDSWAYPLTLPVRKLEEVVRPPEHKGVFFSPDLSLGLAPGGTVAYTASQVAWHGGYRSLYMYGLDLTNTGRFYEESSPQPQMLDKAFEKTIEPAFELLVRETSDSDFHLYNCNPKSRLSSRIIPQMDANESLKLALA